MKGQSVCNSIQPERLVGSLFKLSNYTLHLIGRWDDRIQSIPVIKIVAFGSTRMATPFSIALV